MPVQERGSRLEPRRLGLLCKFERNEAGHMVDDRGIYDDVDHICQRATYEMIISW